MHREPTLLAGSEASRAQFKPQSRNLAAWAPHTSSRPSSPNYNNSSHCYRSNRHTARRYAVSQRCAPRLFTRFTPVRELARVVQTSWFWCVCVCVREAAL